MLVPRRQIARHDLQGCSARCHGRKTPLDSARSHRATPPGVYACCKRHCPQTSSGRHYGVAWIYVQEYTKGRNARRCHVLAGRVPPLLEDATRRRGALDRCRMQVLRARRREAVLQDHVLSTRGTVFRADEKRPSGVARPESRGTLVSNRAVAAG